MESPSVGDVIALALNSDTSLSQLERHDSGETEDDNEPPMAPPEQIFESDGEPPWAPSEASEDSVSEDASRTNVVSESVCERGAGLKVAGDLEFALSVVKEVYAGSSSAGAELALDATRALHPFWNQIGRDSDLGRKVSWVRCSNDWVYGELSVDSFPQLLARSAPAKGETFVDLGCGTGKVATLAALHFSRVFGIELQQELLVLAEKLASSCRARVQRHGVGIGELHFQRADFLGRLTATWCSAEGKPWWQLADVAYACSPKFCEATMRSLAELAAGMRSGSRFVTVRHNLSSPSFEEVWRGQVDFSWGSDDLIVHRRL